MDENKSEVNLGDKTYKVAKESIIEVVGQITQKDIDDGTVLIFRVSEREYPPHLLQKVADSIKNAVNDTFEGKVKAMILPDTIDVRILRDVLKDASERSAHE